tara:strand:+ start:6405 stop:7250 length:846 start_codon:yes stop_codon:yes gene_type:complete
MNRLVIGTANFGQKYGFKKIQVNSKEIKKILNYAWKKNIRYIDTASFYGNTEKLIGKINDKKFKFISKIKINQKFINNPKLIEYSVLKTIKNLKIKKLYALLIHNPSYLIKDKKKKIISEINNLQSEGFLEKIGASIYSNNEIKYLLKNYKMNIIQLPSNIFDRRLKSLGWDKILKKNKIEIHVRSIFLQGLFLNKKKVNYFKKWKNNFKNFENWTEMRGMSKVQACINYVYSQKKINKIVIGVDKLSQLKEILNIKINSKIPFPQFIFKNESKLINPSKW